MSRISQKEKARLAKNLKISKGVKRYYKQLRSYQEYTDSSYFEVRYRLRKKSYDQRKVFIEDKKPIIPYVVEPPVIPVEPKPILKGNEFEFDFADIQETDYETKMINDINFHKFVKEFLEKSCYDDDENTYSFDLHITQVYAGVENAWSFADWYFDAEVYDSYKIATIIMIKLAKIKVTCGFVSQKAILTIEPIK